MKRILLTSAILLSTQLFAQQSATSANTVTDALQKKEQMTKNSLVKNVEFTNIGPTIMSGRVVDVDVNPDNTTEFYVGYASGGLWYTNNNGTSFTPVMDSAPTQNVGDIAVDWKNGTIWVGTGESNSSRSSYAGIGMLKSTDKGKTWKHVGLSDSHHIGRIIINKNNPDEVVVGVVGHLYSANKERGIYKTTDGGKTWKRTLYINKDTGIIDISVSPTNPNVLYAASWERDRKAWNFNGDGNGSAIYKSTDGGNSWNNVTTKNSGFPTGEGVGRIGVAVFNDNVIYALLDNQFRRPVNATKPTSGLQKDAFKTMSRSAFLQLDNKTLNRYLRSNRFDRKDTAESVKKAVERGEIKPIDLARYLENPNSVSHSSSVIGAEVYKSTDGGKMWGKTHEGYLDGVYSSYGYYFGVIGVNASNQNKIYVLGVPLIKSDDGGKTFTSIGKANVHSDHQAIWVNPKKEGHLINGNDGGINITYDDGAHWTKNNPHAVGQFYAINVDNQKPYNVYGGLQDNGTWYGPSNYRFSDGWKGGGSYPYKSLGGGDGMQVQIDNRDNNIVYTGSQFGNYTRTNLKTKERMYISIKHELGDSPYRYNWQTPILLSPHNQDILYIGANKLLRSMDKGETFKPISKDLTTGGKKGNVPYGTLATISESPLQFGLIYTGSDDGLVYVTKDAGSSWTNITNSLPKNLWVSRVIASKYYKNRVYVTLNGYRFDDFNSYVYMSDNYGATWKNIGSGIPASPVNVIKEDSENENILYVGTDNGLYVSFNNGMSWEVFNGIPNVAVHDLVIQEREKDLLVGTHGRSIYKANIAHLQKMTNEIKQKSAHLFAIDNIRKGRFWGNSWSIWREPNTPKLAIPFYVNSDKKVTLDIYAKDVKVNSISVDAIKGFNEATFDVSFNQQGLKDYKTNNEKAQLQEAKNGVVYLPKGKYTVKLGNSERTFEVK